MAIKKSNTTEKKNNKRNIVYHMEEECARFGKKGDVRLTYGRYNNNPEKYYFQTWNKNPNGEGEIPYKCIGFTGEELEELYNVLKAMVEDEDE